MEIKDIVFLVTVNALTNSVEIAGHALEGQVKEMGSAMPIIVKYIVEYTLLLLFVKVAKISTS